MNKNILVLTGQIASGKSTARQWFKAQGLPVLDADQIVHNAYNIKNSQIWTAVYDLYGEKILDGDVISRLKLRTLIETQEDLKQLETTVTGLVKQELLDQTNKLEAADVVWEVPLYKPSWINNVKVLVLMTSAVKQQQYFTNRGKNSNEALDLIKQAQPSPNEYKSWADFVVENNGTLDEFYAKLSSVLSKWKKG